MGIVEFFKKIIRVRDSDLSFLNVGDIIWAKRYNTLEEKRRIKYGHQESPYVIIKKNKKGVFGLQCTSNSHQEVKWKMLYYPLGRLSYEMKKNSYINCLCLHELKEVQFVEMIGHLSDYDLNQLKKQLYILIHSDFKVKPRIEVKYLDFNIGVGDVLLYNNSRYYIYDVLDDSFCVYRLRKYSRRNNNILIDNTYYSFIFERNEKIKIKSRYELIDTFNTGEVELIRNYKDTYMEEYRNKSFVVKDLRVGEIIDYKDSMFYVYDMRDDSISLYRIFPCSYSEKGMADIIVRGGIYKTFFNSAVISRRKLEKSKYVIRRCASSEEIEYNKKIFALPKYKRSYERRKLHDSRVLVECATNCFVPMTILKNVNNNKLYLVISRENNVIEVVNINDLGDHYYVELENAGSVFSYYRVLSKKEFDMYLCKIQEFKDVVKSFGG